MHGPTVRAFVVVSFGEQKREQRLGIDGRLAKRFGNGRPRARQVTVAMAVQGNELGTVVVSFGD
jgi:hypothetical protein